MELGTGGSAADDSTSDDPAAASRRGLLTSVRWALKARLLVWPPLFGLASLLSGAGVARSVALLFDTFVLVVMLRHVVTTLSPTSRLRRAIFIATLERHRIPVADEVVPSDQALGRRDIRLLTGGGAGLAVVAIVVSGGRGWAWATLLMALAYLWLSLKLPRARQRAGLGPLSQPGTAQRDLADSLGMPPAAYTTAGGAIVPPLTLAVVAVALCAVAGGTVVKVNGAHSLAVGRVTVALVPPAGSAPSESPRPSSAQTFGGQTGDAATGLGTGPPGPMAVPPRPGCASYTAVASELRRSGLPAAIASSMNAVWRRVNWPTMGCVAGPADRTGGDGWVVLLQGAPGGDSLLVYTRGRTRVVYSAFAGRVLQSLPEIADVADRKGFGAGQFQFLTYLDGTCGVVVNGDRTPALLLPPAIVRLAAAIGREAGAFPWAAAVRAAASGPGRVYTIRLLVPVADFPGYVQVATVDVAYDQAAGMAAAPGFLAEADGRACGSAPAQLAVLAAPVAASARRHG